jgi:hypothetical protein
MHRPRFGGVFVDGGCWGQSNKPESFVLSRRDGVKCRRAVLLLTIALLTTLGRTGESWGQAKIPRVGILSFGWGATDDAVKQRLEPFRRTLAGQGWIEGKTVSFEYRSTSDPS